MVIINERTERVAVSLPGTTSVTVDYPADVTSRPRSDYTPDTDGVVRGSVRLAASGVIPSSEPTDPSLRDVTEALTLLQASGVPVMVTRARRLPLSGMQVGSFTLADASGSVDPTFTLDLHERRAQRVEVVEIAPVIRATVGAPPPPVEAGQAVEQDRGDAGMTSTAVGFGDFLFGTGP